MQFFIKIKNYKVSSKAYFWILLSLFLVIQIYQKLITTMYVGEYNNGLFQLLNSLQRIENGEKPGVDFFVFHGTGFAYLHYPLYVLFSNPIIGGLVSKAYTPLLLLVALIFMLRRLEGEKFALWFVCTCIFFSIFYFLIIYISAVLRNPEFSSFFGGRGTVFGKDASQKFTRSLIMVFCLLPFHKNFIVKSNYIIGMSLGFLLFSVLDLGICSLIIVSLFYVFTLKFLDLLYILIFVLIGYSMPLLLIGNLDGLLGTLDYQFKQLSSDQFWYYGGLESAFCYADYLAFISFSRWEFYGGILAFYFVYKFKLDVFYLLLLLLSLTSILLSTTAFSNKGYFIILEISIFIVFSKISANYFGEIIFLLNKFKLYIMIAILFSFVALQLLLPKLFPYQQFKVFSNQIAFDYDYQKYDYESKGLLNKVFKEKSLMATFNNINSIRFNTHHPVGFDYFFHATGKYYPKYIDSLKNVSYFELFNIDNSFGFWLSGNRPELLEVLISKFNVFHRTVFSSFWMNADAETPYEINKFSLNNNVLKLSKSLDTNQIAFAEVDYTFEIPWNFIPVLTKTCKIGTKQVNSFRQLEYTYLNPNISKGLVIIYPQKDGTSPVITFEAQKRLHLAEPILKINKASVRVYTLTPEERKVFFGHEKL